MGYLVLIKGGDILHYEDTDKTIEEIKEEVKVKLGHIDFSVFKIVEDNDE